MQETNAAIEAGHTFDGETVRKGDVVELKYTSKTAKLEQVRIGDVLHVSRGMFFMAVETEPERVYVVWVHGGVVKASETYTPAKVLSYSESDSMDGGPLSTAQRISNSGRNLNGYAGSFSLEMLDRENNFVVGQ